MQQSAGPSTPNDLRSRAMSVDLSIVSTDLPTLISHLAAPRPRFLDHSMDMARHQLSTYLLTYIFKVAWRHEVRCYVNCVNASRSVIWYRKETAYFCGQ